MRPHGTYDINFLKFIVDNRIDTCSSLFSESTIMPTTYVQVLRIYYVTVDNVTSFPVTPPAQVGSMQAPVMEPIEYL